MTFGMNRTMTDHWFPSPASTANHSLLTANLLRSASSGVIFRFSAPECVMTIV